MNGKSRIESWTYWFNIAMAIFASLTTIFSEEIYAMGYLEYTQKGIMFFTALGNILLREKTKGPITSTLPKKGAAE